MEALRIFLRRRALLPRSSWLAWIGRHELVSLVALAVVALVSWGLAELTDDVLEGDTDAFDRWLILALRNPHDRSDPIGPQWFEEMVRDITALGGVAVLIGLTLAVAGFLLMERKTHTMVLVLVSVFGGMLCGYFLKMGIGRPRPELVTSVVQMHTTSFPSGHSMGAAVTYLTLAALLARVTVRSHVRAYLLLLGVLLTVLVGASRVYLGVHWPTDVLAGWAAGMAWALLCWAVARLLQRRGAVEPAGQGRRS